MPHLVRTLVAFALFPALAAAQPDGPARVEHGAFTWQGRIPGGRWLYVKNLNGPIRVEPGSGDQVVVTADRVSRGEPTRTTCASSCRRPATGRAW